MRFATCSDPTSSGRGFRPRAEDPAREVLAIMSPLRAWLIVGVLAVASLTTGVLALWPPRCPYLRPGGSDDVVPVHVRGSCEPTGVPLAIIGGESCTMDQLIDRLDYENCLDPSPLPRPTRTVLLVLYTDLATADDLEHVQSVVQPLAAEVRVVRTTLAEVEEWRRQERRVQRIHEQFRTLWRAHTARCWASNK